MDTDWVTQCKTSYYLMHLPQGIHWCLFKCWVDAFIHVFSITNKSWLINQSNSLFKRKKLVTFPILGPGLLFIRTIFLFSYGYRVYFTLLEVKVWKEFFSFFFWEDQSWGRSCYLSGKKGRLFLGWVELRGVWVSQLPSRSTSQHHPFTFLYLLCILHSYTKDTRVVCLV